jgi:GAF domain-containing protein
MLAIRALDRACLPLLLAGIEEREALADAVLALDELADYRLEILIHAQEEESARRQVDSEEQAARAREHARDLAQANEALRRSESRSRHRAEQVGLLAGVLQRVAGILETEPLLQETAATIQARLNYPYVAVVVLDEQGVLVGRWAGRGDIDRHSSGRAQGAPLGVIGRALRRRAPQVVDDVARDTDYYRDVSATRSEMVVPLIDGGEPVGAIDVQSDQLAAFDLEDVAAAEAIAEFLVVALRNARLVASLRAGRG